MLLCHICSSWRRLALACPTLWSHLSYCFTVQRIPEELGRWAFLQNEIEHIMWWKKNQGSIAPFLYFDLEVIYEYEVIDRSRLLAGDGLTFLLKYMSSAQYLQLPEMIWELVEEKLKDGYQFICPNLHTMATTNQWAYDTGSWITDAFFRAQTLIGRLPNQPPSALRRLTIDKNDMPYAFNVIPTLWSSLTHLSLNNVGIHLSFWFPLIRAIPDLQWAFIYFNEIVDIDEYLAPTEHVLPYLATLFVGMPWGDKLHFRPGLLFAGLRLPALRTLSFSCLKMDHEHIPEIHTVLQSAPALTTLTIKGCDALAKGGPEMPAAALGGVTPIWAHTPQLTDVQLALPKTMRRSHAETGALLDSFVHHAFFGANSLWAINDPRCPVRTITLIDMESATALRFNEIENLTRGRIQKCGGGPSNVVFKFITKVEDKSFEEPEAPIWEFSTIWDV
jgi:hypothetical protein